jgi:hypothetical protein
MASGSGNEANETERRRDERSMNMLQLFGRREDVASTRSVSVEARICERESLPQSAHVGRFYCCSSCALSRLGFSPFSSLSPISCSLPKT